MESQSLFEPQFLLDYDDSEGSRYYYVKWKGVPANMSTWEPEESLTITPNLLSASHKYLNNAKSTVEKSKKLTKNRQSKKEKNTRGNEGVIDVEKTADGLMWVLSTHEGVKRLTTEEAKAQHSMILLEFLIEKIQYK